MTVKGDVLALIGTALQGVDTLKTVKRIKKSPVDTRNDPRPGAYYWDEQEEKNKPQGVHGFAKAELRVNVQVILSLTPEGQESFNDPADDLQGEIEDAVFALIDPRQGLIIDISSVRLTKEYPSDVEASMLLEFGIIYVHRWGDSSNT